MTGRPRFVWALACLVGATLGCDSFLDLREDARLVERPQSLEAAAGARCVEYCDLVQNNCTGEHQVYSNRTQCLNLCSIMPPGGVGDLSGNSLECRISNARLAAETAEPASHCPQAGPGGAAARATRDAGAAVSGLSCGSNCDGLCSAMLRLCPEQFASLPACLDDCESVPDLGDYNVTIGQGDSVQCRLFHLGAAASAPEPHCLHAAGATPCR